MDLDYANGLSILDETVSKINEFLEVWRVQGVSISLKIDVKKTKSLKLGQVKMKLSRLVTKRLIKWTASLTCVVLLIKTVGPMKMIKIEQPMLSMFVFKSCKRAWKNRKIILRTKITLLKATVMIAVKYGSKAWAIRKREELYVFQRDYLRIVLTTQLTDYIQTVGCMKNKVETPFLEL